MELQDTNFGLLQIDTENRTTRIQQSVISQI